MPAEGLERPPPRALGVSSDPRQPARQPRLRFRQEVLGRLRPRHRQSGLGPQKCRQLSTPRGSRRAPRPLARRWLQLANDTGVALVVRVYHRCVEQADRLKFPRPARPCHIPRRASKWRCRGSRSSPQRAEKSLRCQALRRRASAAHTTTALGAGVKWGRLGWRAAVAALAGAPASNRGG